MQDESIQLLKCGAKEKDLTSALGALVWPSAPSKLIVTNTNKLYWKLPCQLHLRHMTIQAAKRQLENPKHIGKLTPCERCSVGNYRLHPEPQPDVHRSFFELMTWLAVEAALCTPAVMHYITTTAPHPMNQMIGRDTGYVVECRLVHGWKGNVDIWIPGLNLIIQVDGEHHDDAAHQDTDLAFITVAVQQRFHVLRVHYQDLKYVHDEVFAMVNDCMRCMQPRVLARCSRSHVLHQHKAYASVVSDANK
jgi:hypothetical protein